MSKRQEICGKQMIENAYPLGYTRLNPDTIVQVSLHSYLLLATEVIGGFFFHFTQV
ncbi:hypothetical protein [Ammoniphilus sp. 3BR4]|uniref:hypothetical protein n=1 Tax=Ammoniphilus sp. 3BR4 TaxID=3158265 RepID=UPI0034660DB9